MRTPVDLPISQSETRPTRRPPGSVANRRHPGPPSARRRVALGLAIALVTVAVPALAPGPAVADAPAFADGHWTGNAQLVGGASYQDTVSYTITGGGCVFDLTVAGGKVTKGGINCSGTTQGTVRLSDRTLDVTTQSSAEGPLSGTATEADGPLSVTVTGTVSGLGSGGPYTLGGQAIIKPDTADCGTASGDLAAHWRAQQQAAGMSSNESAVFYAVRDGDASGGGGAPSAGTATAREFNQLMSDLTALTTVTPSKLGAGGYVLELQRLVAAAATYLSHVLAGMHCAAGSAPPHLWQQDVLARAIQKAIEHGMIGPGALGFSVDQLGQLLVAGLQSNAVVPPRSGPGTENALWDAFEAELGKALDLAITNHDQATIASIYVQATGAGMTDLANKAQGAMKK